MFKEFYKKIFKSRKLLSPEETVRLEKELEMLQKEVDTREKQVDKFKTLILQDPDNSIRYVKRMKVHTDLLREQKRRLEEIEIKLLGK
jgi:hypothetical protein